MRDRERGREKRGHSEVRKQDNEILTKRESNER
jgi:hypothetical protein